LGVLVCVFALLVIAGCQDSTDSVGKNTTTAAREVCNVAARQSNEACLMQCSRLADTSDGARCAMDCEQLLEAQGTLCAAPLGQYADACINANCSARAAMCEQQSAQQFSRCDALCDPDHLGCRSDCLERRADDAFACSFLPAPALQGSVALPILEQGKPAALNATLDAAELAVVEAADQRAIALRSRPVRLWTGSPEAAITVRQLQYAFRFGVPLDIREFAQDDGRLEFYGDIARRVASLLVAETSLKWRNSEPQQGEFRFDLADAELAWAESLGFDVKAHVLLWGNDPPLASGSGTPDWLRAKFPDESLSASEKAELRELIRGQIERVVSRYSGRIDVWEVTNEMLNPLTDWFAVRLGQEIVDDVFHWARQADPGAELVYNEWINDIFTGLGGPDAVAVRDRILDLKARGVPVDAVGQQGHFAPGLVNVGIDAGLDQRTRIDDYAGALDTLAETGLPIHITEVTFAAPDDPEQRAAQAEAVMRVWWGHPAVEEIIFWNFWNPLGPRSRLNLGVYGDDGNLTRHGEAILSLLNDRWRTQLEGVTDSQGSIELRATFGDYVAQWDSSEGPRHLYFSIPAGEGEMDVVAVSVSGSAD
jgi:endo-1,4-beta-xylanase